MKERHWLQRWGDNSDLLPQILVAQDSKKMKADHESGYSLIDSAMRDKILVFYLQTTDSPMRINLQI